MVVCRRCAEAIRSHEGRVYTRPIDYEDRDEHPDIFVDEEQELVKCEWCGEEYCDTEAVWIELE